METIYELAVLNARLDKALERHRAIEETADRLGGVIAARDATIAALRAVLAPKLDDPYCYGDERTCVWCDEPGLDPHKHDCPVLRRDELLGR